MYRFCHPESDDRRVGFDCAEILCKMRNGAIFAEGNSAPRTFMDGQPGTTGPVMQFSSYFESDILAAYECAQSMKRRAIFYPEEKLMFAVLTDAILCFQLYGCSENRRNRALFKQAESWIFDNESDSLYSFVSICEVLRISPCYLRRGLRRWRDGEVPINRRLREPLRHPYRIRKHPVYV
jgi:hypothetical protein